MEPDYCRLRNDSIANRVTWKAVTTLPFSLLWAKVGSLLDVGNYYPTRISPRSPSLAPATSMPSIP